MTTQTGSIEAILASQLGFYVEERTGIDVLVFLAQGCHPANSSESKMWHKLVATTAAHKELIAIVGRFLDNATLSKVEGDENDMSVCVDCGALTGSAHKSICEVELLRLAFKNSLQEKI
jgi:hypothetical protein